MEESRFGLNLTHYKIHNSHIPVPGQTIYVESLKAPNLSGDCLDSDDKLDGDRLYYPAKASVYNIDPANLGRCHFTPKLIVLD